MIKIIPKFTKADIKRMLEDRKKRISDAILLNLQKVGETFIQQARSTDTYKDRTGNLRSSIGYVVLYNGLQYSEGGFFLAGQGSDGQKIGKELIIEISKKHLSGWVLICVAGMDYAAAVESKGFDVISSSSIQAETNLKKAIERIKSKA